MTQVTQTNHHNRAISIGKAFCIILMVVGHSGCPQLLKDWLYTFHMPFFFFVSGYLFSDRSLEAFIPFVKRKLKGLWWPFVKWNVVFILLHNLFYKWGLLYGEYSFAEILRKMLLSICMGEIEPFLDTFWFLQQLIRVTILAWIIFKVCKYLSIKYEVSYRNVVLLVNISIAILAVVALAIDFRIPGVMSKLTVVSLLFYISGYSFHSWFTVISQYVYSWWMLLLGICFTLMGTIYNPAEMFTVSAIGLLPYWIVGLLGTVMVLNVSKKIISINWISFMDYIGRNTLIIMVLQRLSLKFLSLLFVWLGLMQHEVLLEWIPTIAKEGWWVLYSVFGVCVPLLIGKFLDFLTEKNL